MRRCARQLSISGIVVGVLLLIGIGAYGQAKSQSKNQSQSKNSLIGSWVMDVTKSRFDPDPQIGRRTMVFTVKDNGFHCLIDTLVSGGFAAGAVTSEYDAAVDGKEYKTPDLSVETVVFNQVDANTIERIGKRNGQQAETYTMKFSDGGKVLTVTVQGTDPMGNAYSSTQVYTKQE